MFSRAGMLVCVWAVAAVCLGALPRTAAATDLTNDRPLAVVDASTGPQLYYRGPNNDAWELSESGGKWGAPTDLGIGPLGSAPAVAGDGSGDTCLYWRGTNGALQVSCATSGSFGTPVQIGIGPMGSEPSAFTYGDNDGVHTAVFYAGTDGNLYAAVDSYTHGGWAGPTDLGQTPLTSSPTAMMEGDGTSNASSLVQVYWRGSDNALYGIDGGTGPDDSFSSGTSGMTPARITAGPVALAPSLTWLSTGRLDLYYGGSNGLLYTLEPTNSSSTPTAVGYSSLASGPTAATVDPSEEDVFWLDSGDNVWEGSNLNVNDTTGWGSPVEIGPLTAPATSGTSTTATATQTTPQTTNVPTPPVAKPGHTPQLRVKITFATTWRGTATRFRRLSFSKLPAHSGVRISCVGIHCPHNLGLTTARVTLATITRHLESDTFRAGQRIDIKVSHTGYRSESVAIIIRKNAEPLARLL